MTKLGVQSANTAERTKEAIARRVASLRKERNLSFDEFAARSGVSKGMLVQMEQGKSNPSIATLCKIAEGLRISLTDLVSLGASRDSPVRAIAPDSMPCLWKGDRGGSAVLLAGCDGPDMLELWTWIVMPGERYEAKPHPAGAQELIHVLEGRLMLEVGGIAHVLAAGFSAAARTDRPHAYACAGRARVRFTMAVAERHVS